LEDSGEAIVGFSGFKGKYITGLSILKIHISELQEVDGTQHPGPRKRKSAPKLNSSMRLSSNISSKPNGDENDVEVINQGNNQYEYYSSYEEEEEEAPPPKKRR
jgi:hypothetical protein